MVWFGLVWGLFALILLILILPSLASFPSLASMLISFNSPSSNSALLRTYHTRFLASVFRFFSNLILLSGMFAMTRKGFLRSCSPVSSRISLISLLTAALILSSKLFQCEPFLAFLTFSPFPQIFEISC